jgi:hypothetical protein
MRKVGSCLIAVPPESRVEQVDAEGMAAVRDVQVHDVGLACARDQAERRRGQVAMRVHQDQASTAAAGCLLTRLHEVLCESKQKAGLAAPRLGNGEQVPAKKAVGQVHRHRMALVGRHSNAASTVRRRDRRGQRKPPARGGSLDERHVILRLHQVPEASELAHVQQVAPRNRPQAS